MNERLPPWMRLKRDTDFARLLKKGRRLPAGKFVLYVLPNGTDYARLGVRVAKRIKGAVRRNYLKRCVREVFRRWLKGRLAGLDVLVIVTGEATFTQIKERLIRVVESLQDAR